MGEKVSQHFKIDLKGGRGESGKKFITAISLSTPCYLVKTF
jgi:hypothetical protein